GLAFRKMAVAHHALLARLGLQIGMLCEKLSNLRFDGLGQQRTRPAAQDLCEGIDKGPWLGELDDVTVRHGVSLLHWRSGGVEHHHDTPPYPVTPSPTSGHSSSEAPAKVCMSWGRPAGGGAVSYSMLAAICAMLTINLLLAYVAAKQCHTEADSNQLE